MIPAALLCACALQAPSQSKPYEPRIERASDEGVKAMALFQLPPGFVVEQWAAEPMLANPVAIEACRHRAPTSAGGSAGVNR